MGTATPPPTFSFFATWRLRVENLRSCAFICGSLFEVKDMRRYFPILLGLLVFSMSGHEAVTQRVPDSPTGRKIIPLRDMIAGSGEESLRQFISEHMAAEVREARSEEELVKMLREIRGELAGAELQGALKTGPYSAKLVLVSESGERRELAYELEPDPPHGIVKLFIESGDESALPDVKENMSDDEICSNFRKPCARTSSLAPSRQGSC